MSTVNSQSESKINRLLKAWPKGTVAVYPWLNKYGVYRQLVDTYEKRHWLKRIGRGAVVRVDDKVDWTGGLYALQTQLKRSIHAGGKTALQLQGYAHFLPLGKGVIVSLFGSPGAQLPPWFKNYQWDVKVRYTAANLFTDARDLCITKKKLGEYSIDISSPERAMMEMLYYVPVKESFEEGRILMEGLTTLRPGLVQKLLVQCRSIKVKRLFLFMMEASNHSWAERIERTKVNLGTGKRVIVKGGKLDSKHLITVPKT